MLAFPATAESGGPAAARVLGGDATPRKDGDVVKRRHAPDERKQNGGGQGMALVRILLRRLMRKADESAGLCML